MKLNLTCPLIFFDLETTGLSLSTDRIVELSYYKIYPNETKESKTYRINPEMHIPEQASSIHSITDADVANCPTFKQIAPEIVRVFEGCDLAGYNSNHFDIPMLAEEFLRADIDFDLKKRNLIDAFVIFQKNEPRNLTAAYRFYCGKELGKDAHSAAGDTQATAEVFFAQLEKYSTLPTSTKKLANYTTQTKALDFAGKILLDANNEAVFGFGKYKNQPVKKILLQDSGYYGWLQQADFPQYTKNIITRLYIEAKQGK